MTSEQLEASRAERLRLNGHGPLHLEDARTWMEETGLCLFLPRKQFASFIAPSLVEAVIGAPNATPDAKQIAAAEALLVRLENDGVAVRLNLQGQPGEQPDYVVASWVLPYVYALRGDRDWRRTPQLTGSRQVSPLAVQAYKLLETGDAAIPALKHTLGREVSESAVLRAITELWQQLRIIPVISAPGQPARWQLLRQRFQKAIAEGASTSQVTAISVLASIYLQAVIAASMEEVELFLAPLTARSKVREVLRGLVATRQVHTVSVGAAPQYYVAGTLPEFSPAPTTYTSASMPASSYFLHSYDHEEPVHRSHAVATHSTHTAPEPVAESPASHMADHVTASREKPAAEPPRLNRLESKARERKPSPGASRERISRHAGAESRRHTARPVSTSRPSSASRWSEKTGPGSNRTLKSRPSGQGKSIGSRVGGHAAHGTSGTRSAGAALNQRNGHGTAHKSSRSNGRMAAAKAGVKARDARKPVGASAGKARSGKRFGMNVSSRQGTKKRG